MSFSIRQAIQELVAPPHRLTCRKGAWCQGLTELRRRGQGRRESGAFLLGRKERDRRHIRQFVYYDELDPHALDRGIINFDGSVLGKLWALCRELGLEVVADVHTHPGAAIMSSTDRTHPTIPQKGHIAIIVPNYAQAHYSIAQLVKYGLYEYRGKGSWLDHSGPDAKHLFYIGWRG